VEGKVDQSKLMEHLQETYGIGVTRLIEFGRGADPTARTYRAGGARDSWFVKTRRGSAPEIGAQVCARLAGLGRSEIVAPIPSHEGRVATEYEGGTVVVWPFRDGLNGFEQTQSPDVLHRVGRAIRAVHDWPTPDDLQRLLPLDRFDGNWRKQALLCAGEAEAAAADDLGRQLALMLRREQPRVERLVEAAALLGLSKGSGHAPGPVLCHADLHAGNVLVGTDGQLTILDWDSAMLALRERDLMFPGAAVAGRWSSLEDVAAFLRGYNVEPPCYEPDQSAIAYFRCDRICEDIVVTSRQILDRSRSDRALALSQLQAQFTPGDVMDSAERSLRQLGLP
jgi:spectinomycin phosphotransferase